MQVFQLKRLAHLNNFGKKEKMCYIQKNLREKEILLTLSLLNGYGMTFAQSVRKSKTVVS